MRLGLNVGYWGMGIGREDQPAVVQEAERLGFDSVWAALPHALIDMVSLCGPPGAVRERLSAFSEARVGTLAVIPMASDRPSRVAQLRAVAGLAA
jgi:alkanesulfonate monooxygenase SsuD/methylene tetrahydromethanopterin reductase-like flavin-dependent oxidoreductase (luciferase family)